MTTEAPTRKWMLTKVGAGDYLLPSNEGAVLWRIYSYEEDASAEVWSPHRQRWMKVTGTFWATCKFNRPMTDIDGMFDREILDWENWDQWSASHRTRQQAIDETMRAGERAQVD